MSANYDDDYETQSAENTERCRGGSELRVGGYGKGALSEEIVFRLNNSWMPCVGACRVAHKDEFQENEILHRVNGQKVAEGRIEHTQCCVFSADEGADVGEDEDTPVTEDYQVPFKFTGTIDKVTIELKEMKKADNTEQDTLRAEAALKKALAD